jgi:DNA-directed RNA polymerase specialized sigma24 family protein
MRLMNNYVYANPFLDPVSLDALAVPDPDDSDVLTHPVEDPAADIEEQFELMRVQTAISVFLRALDARDREIVVRVYWLEETQAAVAKRMRISGAAVSKRLTRIEAKGRTALAALRHSVLLQ